MTKFAILEIHTALADTVCQLLESEGHAAMWWHHDGAIYGVTTAHETVLTSCISLAGIMTEGK